MNRQSVAQWSALELASDITSVQRFYRAFGLTHDETALRIAQSIARCLIEHSDATPIMLADAVVSALGSRAFGDGWQRADLEFEIGSIIAAYAKRGGGAGA